MVLYLHYVRCQDRFLELRTLWTKWSTSCHIRHLVLAQPCCKISCLWVRVNALTHCLVSIIKGVNDRTCMSGHHKTLGLEQGFGVHSCDREFSDTCRDHGTLPSRAANATLSASGVHHRSNTSRAKLKWIAPWSKAAQGSCPRVDVAYEQSS